MTKNVRWEIYTESDHHPEYRDAEFPDRLQGYGFLNERKAVQAARAELGSKSKKGLAFVVVMYEGKWGWLNASSDEIARARIRRPSQSQDLQ
jgi:hypothetical protein